MNRLHAILVSFTIVVLLVPTLNCGDDKSLQVESTDRVLDLPTGPVVIENIERDESNRSIRATLRSDRYVRHLNLDPMTTGWLTEGISAELSDDSGLLFHISIAWDPADRDRLWLEEKTDTDVMTVSNWLAADRLIEEYNINGDLFRIDIPVLDVETKRRTIGHSRHGWRPADPELAELIEQYTAFEAYYDRHSDNSLHNNPDGDMLVGLLLNEQFAVLVVGAANQAVAVKDNGAPGKLSDRAQKICVGASICARFKCMAGGWANPLCVACGGTSIACTFATVACWFANCD